MQRLKVVTGQMVVLGVLFASLYYGKLNPRVWSFAFILLTTARLLTIQLMNALSRRGDAGEIEFLQQSFFRAPPRGVPPPYYTDGDTGRPVGFSAHLLILFTVFGLAFVFLHFDAKLKLNFSWAVFGGEMGWAAILACVYLLMDLLTREMIFDAKLSPIDNLAYNNKSLTILAVAVLICSGLIVFSQSRSQAPSPWLFYGPILVLVHLSELWRGFKRFEP